MKGYSYCSLGLTSEAYNFLTCPAFDCPRGDEPLVIYHDKFNDVQYHEITWAFSLKMSMNCRIRVHADPSLNGKLNVKIVEQAD